MVIGGSTRGSNRSNKVKKKPKQKIEGLSISQYYQMQINKCSKICIVILIYWLNLDYFSISQNSFYTKLLKTKSGWGGGEFKPLEPPLSTGMKLILNNCIKYCHFPTGNPIFRFLYHQVFSTYTGK